MAKKRKVKMMVPFPFDLVSRILLELPLKSLARFKVVSKSCGYLIDDPYFSQSHLKQSTDFILLALRHEFSGDRYDMYLASAGMDSLQNYASETENSPPEKYGRDRILTLASCNGLVCLVYANGDVVLWNIVTKDYHIIKGPKRGGYSYYDGRSFGFGYDSVNDDYKVLRLERNQLDLHKSKVYSLRRDAWYDTGEYRSNKFKGLPSPTTCDMGHPFWRTVCCCDALHWMVHRDDLQPYYFLLAFDLVTEDFREVPQLDNFYEEGGQEVATLGGCLCVMITWRNNVVWVMKDYMVKESWTKLFSISLPPHAWCSYLLRRGDRVLIIGWDDYFYWYDLEKKQAERLVDNCCSGTLKFAVICVPSLVSLRAYRGTRRRGHSN